MKVRRLVRRLSAFIITIGLFNFVIVVQRSLTACTGSDVNENEYIARHTHAPGGPYIYPEVVDIRIIVLTLNRAASLATLLLSLDYLELDGDRAMLEIWIDRDAQTNGVDCETLTVAREYVWSGGETRVHIHQTHVGIYGQWIDTWRPQSEDGGGELALILEDDLTVSPYAYRWLKAAHRKYGSRPDIAGYTLQSEDVNLATGVGRLYSLSGPPTDTAFLYKRIGTWGFAPHPRTWRLFQDWYRQVRTDSSFRPYVEKAAVITEWYKNLEKRGHADSMWSMWHVYHSDINMVFTVYNNLRVTATGDHVALVENRKEHGLHFSGSWLRWLKRSKLLTYWSDTYVQFPDSPVKYDWDGIILE